ncbi:MAG TPA: hypothetical protein VGO46_04165 [Gemmatimonadaceae bacterium]|jgi:hypothetical protein|nr:hypothetical protein [Gemmatimonadaceae bacterium]
MKALASWMTARSVAWCSGALLLTAACAGDSRPAHQKRPEAIWNLVAHRSWTIPAGAEAYQCHTERLASDEYLTGFRIIAPHAAQSRVTLSVLGHSPTQGDFECSGGAASESEMIYASGAGTDAFEFPSGQGVHLAAGQYLLLVVHLRNTASSAVTASTRIEGRVGRASEMRSPIEMRFAGGYPSLSTDDAIPEQMSSR